MQLLALAQQGDSQALSDLYARYGERLRAIVRIRLGSRLRRKLESVDIVQEAFIASLPYVNDARFASEGAFLHWLATLAENRVRDIADHFNAQKRNVSKEVPFDGTVDDRYAGALGVIGTETTPSQIVGEDESRERLESAIDELAEPQRDALLLVRYEGLTLAEAGAKLGRSPDAVRMLVARAIVALGKVLGSDSTPG